MQRVRSSKKRKEKKKAGYSLVCQCWNYWSSHGNSFENRPHVQVPQCTIPISHNVHFCNRNVHMWAHFCHKMHLVIFVGWIVGFSNHQPHDCLFNRLFRRRSKKTSKLPATGLCEGNSPETGEFPTQRVSNAENVSIWWRHDGEGIRRVTPAMAVRWHALRGQNLIRVKYFWLIIALCTLLTTFYTSRLHTLIHWKASLTPDL